MGKLRDKINKHLWNVFNNNEPIIANELQMQLSKKLKESFQDCYEKAASTIPGYPDECGVPLPGSVGAHIERLSIADQRKAIEIINDWYSNCEKKKI